MARARTEVAGDIARYLGAASIFVVGAVHAQQYYDAYFSYVPTIGTLFLLSFIGAAIVGVVLLAPARKLGRRLRNTHWHSSGWREPELLFGSRSRSLFSDPSRRGDNPHIDRWCGLLQLSGLM